MNPENDHLAQLWAAILGKSARKIKGQNTERILKSTRLVRQRGKVLTIQVPSADDIDVLQTHFENVLAHAAREVLGFAVKIAFAPSANEPAPKSGFQLRRFNNSLVKNQTFESFAVGASNRLAHSAASSICNEQGGDYNPLYIYGGGGIGKTHLLNAIANAMRAQKMKVLLIHAEKFINDYVSAATQKNSQLNLREFRAMFDSLDCLIIDEFQAMEDKPKTCSFFAHIINDFVMYGSQIVIASNKQIKSLSVPQMLLSRLTSGLATHITNPNKNTRADIFAQIAKMRQFPLSDELLEMLAEQHKLTIPQFNGVLREIIARSRLVGETVSSEQVRDIVAIKISEEPKPVTAKQVLKAVSQVTGVSSNELCGKGQQRNVVLARRAAIYIMNTECGMSFVEISNELGNRKRQSVHVAYNQFAEKMKQDADATQIVSATRERISATSE